MTATFPSNVPAMDFSSSKSTAFAIDENQFGDGYAQRSSSGLNNTRDTWNASWTNLKTAEKDILEPFLRGLQGWQTFYMTAPGDSSPKKWTCRDLKVNPADAGYWNITCTLRQEFDL